MNPMFEKHTGWTEAECFYVIAFQGNRRAWLAGPYRTRAKAEDVLPRAVRWALTQSDDSDAATYTYRVAQHHDGEVRSILGEVQP